MASFMLLALELVSQRASSLLWRGTKQGEMKKLKMWCSERFCWIIEICKRFVNFKLYSYSWINLLQLTHASVCNSVHSVQKSKTSLNETGPVWLETLESLGAVNSVPQLHRQLKIFVQTCYVMGANCWLWNVWVCVRPLCRDCKKRVQRAR